MNRIKVGQYILYKVFLIQVSVRKSMGIIFFLYSLLIHHDDYHQYLISVRGDDE